jgi:hypothetical protein
MDFKEKKQDFLTETDLRLREMALNIEKAELEAAKQKKQIDENLKSMKNAKDSFASDMEKLKDAGEKEWDDLVEEFEEKYHSGDIMDEVSEKAKEYSEKTKKFLSSFGSKVSDLYHKSIEDMKKTSAKDKGETETPETGKEKSE